MGALWVLTYTIFIIFTLFQHRPASGLQERTPNTQQLIKHMPQSRNTVTLHVVGTHSPHVLGQ